MKHVVKRKGHKEEYDERKLYASIYATCMSLRITNEEAELIAANVVSEVSWKIQDKYELSSRELTHLAMLSLKVYNPDASYLYEHHKDIS